MTALTAHLAPQEGRTEDVGSWVDEPCRLCGHPTKRPIVRVGEPVRAGLTFVEGFGLMHPPCALAVTEGRIQGVMELGDVA